MPSSTRPSTRSGRRNGRDDEPRGALVTGAAQGIGARAPSPSRRPATGSRSSPAPQTTLDRGRGDAARRDAGDRRRRDRSRGARRRRSPPSSRRGARSRCSSSTPAPRCRRRWSKTSDEDWQRMLDVNLTAPFRCLRRALPAMTSAGWGRVVVIASIAGKTGGARIAAYTASKHGVLGLVAYGGCRGRAQRGHGQRGLPGLRRHPDDRRVRRQHLDGTGRSSDDARSPVGERSADRPTRSHRRRSRRP